MFMRAQVLNRQGEPVVEAEVDIWHSSSVRLYENRDPIQESMNQRGKFTTDDDGRFWFQLVKPTGYPIPTHGVVGKLLAVQSRHPFRPAHVHALIFKEGYKTLISEVYADDAPNLETDLAFGVTQVLVARFERHDEPPPTEPNAGTPWYSLDYTFVMEPGVATLPRPLIKWSRLYWTQAYTFEGERLITLWLLAPARLSKHPLRAVTDQVDPDHLGLIGIGGHLTVPPLPHHRAYGSRTTAVRSG
jgi:hypothetical protein